MIIEILGVLIAGIALIVAVLTIQATVYIRRREFEDIYVQRYWTICDQIPTNLRVELSTSDAEFNGDSLGELEKRALWDYLMLCEDEIDLRAQGQVTDETWDIWKSSIVGNMGRYPYKPMFVHIESLLEHVPEKDRPFQNLRKIFIDPNSFEDPWQSNGFVSFMTGRREWPRMKARSSAK